jgi:hypothetical protein
MNQKVFIKGNRQHGKGRRTEGPHFPARARASGDSIDLERAAQREEFLRREGQGVGKNRKPSHSSPPKKPAKVSNSKRPAFEKQLGLTNQWLEETFPHLFAADDYLPLDGHVLRDIKNDYRNNQVKKGYPPNLVIKAALALYKENPGYLACLKAGAPRHALDGSVTGTVTREEEDKARGILISDQG